MSIVSPGERTFLREGYSSSGTTNNTDYTRHEAKENVNAIPFIRFSSL